MKYVSKHSVKIPSFEKKLEFREYTVGEEKEIILIDKEDNTEKKFERVKNIVKKCLSEKIDLTKISPSEIWFLFICMRIYSVGNDAIINVNCPTCLNEITNMYMKSAELEEAVKNMADPNTATDITNKILENNKKIRGLYQNISSEVTLDLNNVKVITDPNHKHIIELTEGLKYEMNYGINEVDWFMGDIDLDTLTDDEKIIYTMQQEIKILASCINTIYEDENIISNLSLKEKYEIIENLPSKFKKKLEQFLVTQPKLEYKGNSHCNNCNKDYEYVLDSYNDFF